MFVVDQLGVNFNRRLFVAVHLERNVNHGLLAADKLGANINRGLFVADQLGVNFNRSLFVADQLLSILNKISVKSNENIKNGMCLDRYAVAYPFGVSSCTGYGRSIAYRNPVKIVSG